MAANAQWKLQAISNAAKCCYRQTFILIEGENRIGRSDRLEISIPSLRCSRNHCSIKVDGDRLQLIDSVRISI